MKCFTIKSGNEYIEDVPKVISKSFYNGIVLYHTEDVDLAKHYKNGSTPKTWIKKSINNIESDIKNLNSLDNKNYSSFYINESKRNLNKHENIIKWLQNAKVIELDLEKPNFPSKYKIRFDKSHTSYYSGGSRMKLETCSHSRYTCKACGIKLKNIPFYNLTDGNPTKICIPCLYLRLDSIKKAFEGMPEDFRTDIVNELILGNL